MQRRTAVERGMTLKAIDEARRLLSSEAFTETAVLLSGGTDLAEAYRTRLLRAMHFYREDGRAQGESDALERGDFEAFLHLVQNSGESSYCLLQNVYPSSVPAEQPVSIAIAVGSAVLGGRGAIRVHGGGFGGTVQAFVPSVLLTQFRDGMEAVLGEGCCHVLQIRPIGGMTILI